MDLAVVRTHSGAQRRAMTHLDRQGFDHFFPQYRTVETRRGARVDAVRYVFQDYGFVDMSSSVGSVRSLRGTRGVAEVLESGNVESAELARFVGALRASMDSEGFVVMPELEPKRRVRQLGDRVRVESGPLQGYRGLYDGQTTRQRVFVLLRMMGSTRRIRVLETDLEAA